MISCILCRCNTRENKSFKLSEKINNESTLLDAIKENINCADIILKESQKDFQVTCTTCFKSFKSFYDFIAKISSKHDSLEIQINTKLKRNNARKNKSNLSNNDKRNSTKENEENLLKNGTEIFIKNEDATEFIDSQKEVKQEPKETNEESNDSYNHNELKSEDETQFNFQQIKVESSSTLTKRKQQNCSENSTKRRKISTNSDDDNFSIASDHDHFDNCDNSLDSFDNENFDDIEASQNEISLKPDLKSLQKLQNLSQNLQQKSSESFGDSPQKLSKKICKKSSQSANQSHSQEFIQGLSQNLQNSPQNSQDSPQKSAKISLQTSTKVSSKKSSKDSKKSTESSQKSPKSIKKHRDDVNRRKHPSLDPEGEEKIRKFCEIKCHICNVKAESFSRLKKHVKSSHPKEQAHLVCCGKKFTRRFTLLDHIEYHDKSKVHRCEECNKEYSSKFCLNSHIKLIHQKVKRDEKICSICGKLCANQSVLNAHMATHDDGDGKTYECYKCRKFTYKNLHLLKNHMSSRHRYKKPDSMTVCHICSAKFRESYLPIHLKKLHSNEDREKIQCDICGFWLLKTTMKTHIAKHSDMGVNCGECGKFLKSSYSLSQHMKVAHTDNFKFKCVHCDKGFFREMKMLEHVAVKHTREFLFNCRVPGCERRFRAEANWRIHERKMHRDYYDRHFKPFYKRNPNEEFMNEAQQDEQY